MQEDMPPPQSLPPCQKWKKLVKDDEKYMYIYIVEKNQKKIKIFFSIFFGFMVRPKMKKKKKVTVQSGIP